VYFVRGEKFKGATVYVVLLPRSEAAADILKQLNHSFCRNSEFLSNDSSLELLTQIESSVTFHEKILHTAVLLRRFGSVVVLCVNFNFWDVPFMSWAPISCTRCDDGIVLPLSPYQNKRVLASQRDYL
jgi:hypothetical protein